MADTVLVTGGSGFIGSHLSRMLVERGDKVINFDIKYRDVREGMKEYADRYCEFLICQGKTPAKRAW